MREVKAITLDANEAVASVAHRLSEVIAIYPITPASPMGEHCDDWSAKGKVNLFGQVPRIVEMQSEAGAAGAVHGALQAGSLATTFTASQGLLLMIPNMFKIAGELLPTCIHVAARSIATHALSIFGDHSDVMACRGTGFAMLAAGSVQEAQDFAAVAHAATLTSRIPFLHFFDGFRTSHEIAKIEQLDDDTLRALLSEDTILAHRRRALTPDKPTLRGTAQNPDAFFQAREAANPYYDHCPEVVQRTMDLLAKETGRSYHLFDYAGHPEATRVIVMMGSGAGPTRETVEHLVREGQKVGLLEVRLYRPFAVEAFLRALPPTVERIAVLDRTKEPGAPAEPLHLDVLAALAEQPERRVLVVGGRYGLSSKEYTPASALAVFQNLEARIPKKRFTVGIVDDVTHLSLDQDPAFDIEPQNVVRAVFFGLGSDGTVSSNKSTIKIIGEETELSAQGHFVYDSKKAGAVTVSHLRFGPGPIRSAYEVCSASFVACHQPQLVERLDILERASTGATFLLNAPWPKEEAFSRLPFEMQQALVDKKMRFFLIDAQKVAEEAGLGRYVSTIMQACFFALSGVLLADVALEKMRTSIQKTFGKRGAEIVEKNLSAVSMAVDHLEEVAVPAAPVGERRRPKAVPARAPDFVQRVTAVLMEGKGDLLPVSAFPVDGTWPTQTALWDKRSLALNLPAWDPAICIQCNKCALICPHSAIRTTVFSPELAADAPPQFLHVPYKGKEYPGSRYVVQVAPDDCTGCNLCSVFCPAKDKSNPRHKALDMVAAEGRKEVERPSFAFFEALPVPDRAHVALDVKGSQFFLPLFEYSGACAGCGETPYIKLLTQLFGDRLLVANATGCSSIYGGNLPTTPWSKDGAGRGPAWSNSLFEDNAEFGLGFRLSVDTLGAYAASLATRLAPQLGDELVHALTNDNDTTEAGLRAQRERVVLLRRKLATLEGPEARMLLEIADYLVQKSVWIVGGDGWAYDIGYGGLDHVIASGQNVNLLVLDTEVYSNTGGQASKATPLGAAAKFAAAGKETAKKDLGLLAMTYGSVYVARIAMGAKDAQTVKALLEAESYPGPSLVIAYSHCIAHGYDMAQGADQQRLAVDAGIWPLYRFDPRRIAAGEPPLHLDSPEPKAKVRDYMRNEGRFRMVELANPKHYASLVSRAERDAAMRRSLYEQLSRVALLPKGETP